MSLGLSIALTIVIAALVAVPSWRLGRRLGASPAQRSATPEERAERKRRRAVRRKEALAALTMPERVLLYTYYVLAIPAAPVGILLTVYGHHTTRTVGLVVLGVAVLLTAVPVGPILDGRVRRRQRARSAGSASA